MWSCFSAFIFFSHWLHALHMIIGVGISLHHIPGWRGSLREYYNRLKLSGLYWQLVDLVWIFLFRCCIIALVGPAQPDLQERLMKGTI